MNGPQRNFSNLYAGGSKVMRVFGPKIDGFTHHVVGWLPYLAPLVGSEKEMSIAVNKA